MLQLAFPFSGLANTAQRWTNLIAEVWREQGGTVERVECVGGGGTPPRRSPPRSGRPAPARQEAAARPREPESPPAAGAEREDEDGGDADRAFRRALALFEGQPLAPADPGPAHPAKEG